MKRWVLIGLAGLIVLAALSSWMTGRELEGSTDPKRIAELILNPGDGELEVLHNEYEHVVVVTYFIGDSWSNDSLLKTWHEKASRLIPVLFRQVEGVQKVQFVLQTEFVDSSGGSRRENAGRMEFGREAASRVDWGAVSLDAIPRAADDYFLRAALR